MAKVQRATSVRQATTARLGLAAENAMLRTALARIARGQKRAAKGQHYRWMTGPEMQREAQQTLVSIGVTRWSE